MSKVLAFIRGEPGTGKDTVSRMLSARLGWRRFWMHDLDPIAHLVPRQSQAQLLDELTEAVLRCLLATGEGLIYVRPSRDRHTVERVCGLAAFYDYRTVVVRLCANRETLVRRVEGRGAYGTTRIGSRHQLDEYLGARPLAVVEGEHPIVTDDLSPEQVAAMVQELVHAERS